MVVAAHDILHGDDSMRGFEPVPLGFADPQNDISFIHAETPEECVAACVELVKNKIPQWYGADRFPTSRFSRPCTRARAA